MSIWAKFFRKKIVFLVCVCLNWLLWAPTSKINIRTQSERPEDWSLIFNKISPFSMEYFVGNSSRQYVNIFFIVEITEYVYNLAKYVSSIGNKEKFRLTIHYLQFIRCTLNKNLVESRIFRIALKSLTIIQSASFKYSNFRNYSRRRYLRKDWKKNEVQKCLISSLVGECLYDSFLISTFYLKYQRSGKFGFI